MPNNKTNHQNQNTNTLCSNPPTNKLKDRKSLCFINSHNPTRAHNTCAHTRRFPPEKTCHHTRNPRAMTKKLATTRCLTRHPPVTKQINNILLRKEVIQPHLPVRLPCYDFVPIANPTFDHSPHQTVVRPWASGVTNFHDVTGGVYKARERIHRSIADLRLLATPTSWGRVADPNPN